MQRLLALLTVGFVAGTAVADVPPPPPPKGKKYVSVNNEVILGKDVAGYVFVQQVRTGFPSSPKFTHSKPELSESKAVSIPTGGKYTYVTLFAVPQAAAKEFKTDADLFAALQANKVKEAHHIGFGGTATVSDTVKGASVKWTYTITAIDPKKGITTKVEGEGAEPPRDKPGKKDQPQAQAGTWVAGTAAFAAVMLGGFWLAGRTRRKV